MRRATSLCIPGFSRPIRNLLFRIAMLSCAAACKFDDMLSDPNDEWVREYLWTIILFIYQRTISMLFSTQTLLNRLFEPQKAEFIFGLIAKMPLKELKCTDLTVPLVFFRTVAANSWVTPTRLIPSTSTIWSFTCMLDRQKTVER